MKDRCLLVFTKPPRPGLVKTRLIGDLSAAEAAELHGAMVEDVVAGLGVGSWELIIDWALEAGESAPEDWPRPGVRAWRQSAGDLGARLREAAATALEEFASVCIVGTDHPGLEAGVVEQAFSLLLDRAEVVFGPAADGGYYLVGMRAGVEPGAVFPDIEWSTSEVLTRSLAHCAAADLEVELLEVADDVDTPEDLGRLRRRLRERSVEAPAVRELLGQWDERRRRIS